MVDNRIIASTPKLLTEETAIMLTGTIAFASTGFWMLMIFDCIRNEPKGSSWLWLLIVLNFPGALIYFVSRKLPYLDIPVPSFFKRWTMKDALWNAEAGVSNIGKSHQYVTLGNVLTEMGDLDRALSAYQSAIAKEPNNTHALWGCATIAMQRKNFDVAREQLQQLLALDAEYKRGEASLLYGKALYELAQWSAARSHFESDVKRWGHAESLLLLAKIALNTDGDSQAAKSYLETMVSRLRASPKFNYRKNQHLIRSAQKMLKNLK
jgi:tetratricopeptide (TPR) repeat protein